MNRVNIDNNVFLDMDEVACMIIESSIEIQGQTPKEFNMVSAILKNSGVKIPFYGTRTEVKEEAIAWISTKWGNPKK
jgi:hypothetical protein